ncbi:hypothetical protein BMW22_41610 (plasmid) [Rhizobium leguminosarum]|uniref:Uncharacterized protein n=1 Tax=Rhizobium leguminosarum TaxID=384 RepID=A0A1L3ZQ62_RHILE|nr:hypothetical protein [Rhizobium leguminosarum]API57761.1 hypothetical protein BMW22_41610 [Rhizobium leguminosarum]
MAHYQVTVSMIIEANDQMDAAMRAYGVLHDLTPDTFEVKDANTSQRVVLRGEDQEEALRRSLPGKRSTDVKGTDRIR